jgi:hypothetical protein
VSSPGTPIDRITLATDAFAPRSSLLHLGPGEHPGLLECSWWVYAATHRLPPRILASDAALSVRGETAQGTVVTGMVRVADRHDDAYGTELCLAGLGALVGGPAGAASGDAEARHAPHNR